ncbi:hypothetical protein MKW94_020086 [Papaver nudicaule]|uniref:Uncharacterized protein n=1 Tax=Papaver nudicaule TaxID=74823 RepID=A0AA41VBZ2_PAPNU|nr:hypothetical protein [Papaver nudicaule]MCL7034437.1 hypothetical protein [Papaver nudicaule]MCL7036213.1 hypothetical protein [Papaver nudicaule]
MSTFLKFNTLGPKTKNFVAAGGLTGFVFGVYFYTMRVVGVLTMVRPLLIIQKCLN